MGNSSQAADGNRPRSADPGEIVFVVPYRFVPPLNGGHRAAFGFATHLARERHLLCLSTDNNGVDAPFPILRCFRDRITKYLDPVVGLRIRRILRRKKTRHLLLFQPFMGLLLWPFSRGLGLRLSVYVQNIEYQRFRTLGKWWWPLMYALEYWVYRRCDFLFFISPDDLQAGVRAFRLPAGRCACVPYGTLRTSAPSANERQQARQAVIRRHGFSPEDFLIIFFGPQHYRPNLEAVERIAFRIHPELKARAPFRYRILICGGGLPEQYRKFEDLREEGIEYLGFVENIDQYVMAADVMINPVTTGGGVKTKIIEALALGTPVISSRTGAIGMDGEACGEALATVDDDDYGACARALIRMQAAPAFPIPASFFQTYFWGNAIAPALQRL